MADTADADAPVDRSQWGYVDAEGTVFVRTADGPRAIGSWQAGPPEEALEFYGRRYDGLAVEVDLLERRIRDSHVPEKEARAAIDRLRTSLVDFAAIGDLAALASRVEALSALAGERAAQARAARAEQQAKTRALKERIVADAEAVAAGTEWRVGGDRIRALLEEWKAAPRLDRRSDDELWQRFSAARSTFGKRRKAHYAELATQREAAKAAKEALVAKAESLAESTDWGPTASTFRTLMQEWKAAGRAPREVDDALWARFRTAQDTFFGARKAAFAARDAERASAAASRQAEREAERTAAAEVRAKAQDAKRRQDNEFARARAQETVEALREAIAGYEKKAEKAQARGDDKAASEAREAAVARREWLAEAERLVGELS